MRNIAKECYEKIFSTQKYEESNLCNTYNEVVGSMIREAKREQIISMLDPELIAKYGKTQEERMAINTYLRCHLSTFPKEKGHKWRANGKEPSPKPCPKCNGKGEIKSVTKGLDGYDLEDCPDCEGQGFIKS